MGSLGGAPTVAWAGAEGAGSSRGVQKGQGTHRKVTECEGKRQCGLERGRQEIQSGWCWVDVVLDLL